MSRKKQEVHEDTTKAPTPLEMGRTGTIKDFYAAAKAADEDLEAKRVARYESERKKDKAWFSGPIKQYRVDRDAHETAKDAPYHLRIGFHAGAFEAFLKDHPENIQHIMANPQDFYRFRWASDRNIAVTTLVALMEKSATPDTVPEIALEKVTADEKRNILDRTLLQVVSQSDVDERKVSALLNAGADASYDSNEIMARALHHGAPDGVINMLLEHGADCDKALETMYNDRRYYDDTPYELKILQQATRINELERAMKETKKDITAPVKQLAVASPVLAAAAVTHRKLIR